jgi:hypothetical protein
MTSMPHDAMPAHLPLYGAAASDRRNDDPTLAAVLLAKQAVDDVPLATWWFLAESLRHSVCVRRAAEGVASLGAAEFELQVSRASLYAETALEELDQQAADPMSAVDVLWRHPALPNNATLRVTICALACLMVKSRAVTPVQLKATILAHLRALRLATQ